MKPVLFFIALSLLTSCVTLNHSIPVIDCDHHGSKQSAWDIATEKSYALALAEMPERYAYWVHAHVPPWERVGWDEQFMQPEPYYHYWDNEAMVTHPEDLDYYERVHDYWIRTVEIRKQVMSDYPCDFGAWND